MSADIVLRTQDAVTLRALPPQIVSVGAMGPQGATGATGPAGPGVPVGGTTGQVLAKSSATDYATEWVAPSVGALTLIASVELTAGQAAITFTSIPQTFSGLRLQIIGACDLASVFTDWLQLRFNGDTGNNYGFQRLRGVGSNATAAEFNNTNHAEIGTIKAAAGTDGWASQYAVEIFGYKSAFVKTVLATGAENYRAGDTHAYVINSRWNNTAAITELTVFPSVSSFLPGTICNLYGVA